VTETASERGGRIVGRETELGALDGFLDPGGPQGAFVLAGEPGIGKSTLWEAGIDLARRRGFRVLSTRGSGAETRLSFAGLIDLLDEVGPEELAGLPSPQVHALEVALLRSVPTGDPPPQAAISFGFLNVVRALAAQQPVLVAVDDVQWLDSASGEAVAFVVRRREGQPLWFLFAKRSRTTSFLERANGPKGLHRLELSVMSIGAIQRLLADRLGLSLSRHVLRRVVESTLGNPLFALELGRMLATRGPLAIGEDVPLPQTVDELLGSRVAALNAPARKLVLAAALGGDLRLSQVAEIAEPAALDEAVGSGVLVVEGDRVRAAHPLYATAAKSGSRLSEQRELHLVLAQHSVDDESRALHLALATDRSDEALATEVAAAAAAAAARGARPASVVLAEHALRLTPPTSPERTERLLALAAYLVTVGELERVTDLLSPELDSLPAGVVRAQALLLLAEGAVTNHEIRRYLADALSEGARDERLRAIALAEIASNDVLALVEGIPDAEKRASEAVETARGVGPEAERIPLNALAWVRSLRGRAVDDLQERFREVSAAAPYLAVSPDRIAAQRLVWRGEVVEARTILTQLLSVSDKRGEPVSYMLQRLHLCELELRAGAWDEATRLLDEWAREGEFLDWPCHDRCRALVAAGRGLSDDTQRLASQAIAQAQRIGIRWDLLEATRARGIGALLTRDLGTARESLGFVWDHVQREGVDEPGVFPVAPDLVEALAELGELEEAQAVTDRLRRLSDEQDHPWGRATTRRCAALVRLAARGDGEEAATALGEAADAYAALGLRFDRARSLLSLGRAERRLKKWGAARSSLEQAAIAFDELGSPGWAEQARAELGRVGGRRRGASGELTPAERRVVELAADGLANKEIAQSLFVTVRTVEDHLKNAYAKLGVRSRTQLARRISERT
jgi:DNA-binding NarL/FixJ family response regulator